MSDYHFLRVLDAVRVDEYVSSQFGGQGSFADIAKQISKTAVSSDKRKKALADYQSLLDNRKKAIVDHSGDDCSYLEEILRCKDKVSSLLPFSSNEPIHIPEEILAVYFFEEKGGNVFFNNIVDYARSEQVIHDMRNSLRRGCHDAAQAILKGIPVEERYSHVVGIAGNDLSSEVTWAFRVMSLMKQNNYGGDYTSC